MSSGSIPGAWAPSTSTWMPRAASAAAIPATGKMSAVGLVTWATSASLVRDVTAPRNAASTSSGPAVGNGTRATTTRAPSRSAAARSAFSEAL